ncbi:MAG: hypothetical protein DDT23_01346 [candidate division WS2 bacterium]|nr:hypothetical protein [Candidatus Lithacetigena glycinireducens]
MLSEQKFKEGMAILCETFDRKLSDLLLKGYEMVLKDLSDAEFEKAIGVCLSSNTFHKLPLPAEILEAARGNIEEKALLALNRLEDAIKKYGHYRSIVFEDKIIHMVVQAMDGWQEICLLPLDEWKWKRKEFVELYKVFSTNPRGYPEKLIGYHDHYNSIHGFEDKIGEPVFIGANQKRLEYEGAK